MEKNEEEYLLNIDDFSFSYPNDNKITLNKISLSVKKGEFIVLCGPSGCGKTTLLRQCKPSLAANGEKSGSIYFDGVNINELSKREAASKIGFVQQNPDNQIVTDKVWHELSFGLESLGLDSASIRLQVAETASFFGISDWFYRDVNELSGGQKQLLALASVMILKPSLLILDEPTSQLDPIAASEFLAAVGKINNELGITVVMTEHRLDEAFQYCTGVAVMDSGNIICDGTPSKIASFLKEANHSMFSSMPVPMRIWYGVRNNYICPVTIKEGRQWISNMQVKNPVPIYEDISKTNEPCVVIQDAWFRYGKNEPDVIKGLNFSACKGEITAILGGNAAGKTTALSLISGLNKPYRGTVKIFGEEIDKIPAGRLYNHFLGVLPQSPQLLFTENTVEKDLLEILENRDMPKSDKMKKVAEIASICGLENLMLSHPYDLSGGEQQRAALAKVLLTEPEILLLDEPTKGLDAEFKKTFAGILRTLSRRGVTVIFVSHDIEFCAEYADRCALIFDGDVVTEGSPQSFFSGNSFYTTAANKMSRHMIKNAVTANDVITALGGKADNNCKDRDTKLKAFSELESSFDSSERLPVKKEKSNSNFADKKKAPSKNSIASAAIFLILMPLTVFAGLYFFEDRKYYFISVIMIVESMLAFALNFEQRKPKAREIVILAVIVALAVAGRAAFFWIPQFKPVAAIVIISGAAFGGEAGFLVGALSAFISNMIFGQGPWTPWQMLALGIIGYLSGLLFSKGRFVKSKIALCLFGAFSTYLIYGGLMNVSTVLTYQSNPSIEMFLTTFIQALPFDLVHTGATIIFLAVLSNPMMDKLSRIKIKYGLVDN